MAFHAVPIRRVAFPKHPTVRYSLWFGSHHLVYMTCPDWRHSCYNGAQLSRLPAHDVHVARRRPYQDVVLTYSLARSTHGLYSKGLVRPTCLLWPELCPPSSSGPQAQSACHHRSRGGSAAGPSAPPPAPPAPPRQSAPAYPYEASSMGDVVALPREPPASGGSAKGLGLCMTGDDGVGPRPADADAAEKLDVSLS